jgi:DNA invertase Pin-like site-specific DNA recombinase
MVVIPQKYVSYIRVSTKKQGQSGLGLAAQQEAVKNYTLPLTGKIVAEFVEVEHATRKGNGRPQLAAALSGCRAHGATLVIAKLDRLARNVAFVSALMESGVPFVCCDNPNATPFTIHILAAVAEHEAKMISERTRAALQAAKKRGVKLGGTGENCAQIAAKGNRASARVRSEAAQRRAADLLPVIEQCKANGAVTLRQIAAQLNQRQIPASRGGSWSGAQVSRVMA